FAQFHGVVHLEDEAWLSAHAPKVMKQYNVIFGGFVCVHYAFGPQRDHLEKTNVLDLYRMRIMQVGDT
ncbi:hypothetical protein EBT25_16145, partial [bacterium]|nr:hypothetical protein [bacterium]